MKYVNQPQQQRQDNNATTSHLNNATTSQLRQPEVELPKEQQQQQQREAQTKAPSGDVYGSAENLEPLPELPKPSRAASMRVGGLPGISGNNQGNLRI